MTAFDTVRYEVADRIATITLCRPQQHNTFTIRMAHDLVAAFDLADADDVVRAVILTGDGRDFCFGADLDEGFATNLEALPDDMRAEIESLGSIGGVVRDAGGYVSLRIARSLKPVIAAINGTAVGIGVTLTLPADIRLAGESSRLGLVFARRGLVPEAASSWFLPRIVGIARAVEWVSTARILTAAEALEGGLVSYVVPDRELIERARGIAREIAENTSAVAVAVSRQLLWGMLSAPSPWHAHAIDSRAIYHLASQPDVVEGVAAFFEGRLPDFPLTVSADYPDYVPNWPNRPEELGK